MPTYAMWTIIPPKLWQRTASTLSMRHLPPHPPHILSSGSWLLLTWTNRNGAADDAAPSRTSRGHSSMDAAIPGAGQARSASSPARPPLNRAPHSLNARHGRSSFGNQNQDQARLSQAHHRRRRSAAAAVRRPTGPALTQV
ncbi:hypothetical protein C8Q70DRAFT_553881 [Cubamyces menziesii]|nr:hypothetical protein C8Q70DRAFT_553881 [Cubamyces menziesii]